jgi:uncharacterized membrane protein YeaQ/YmgE (transglycosylase-associated protein family)
MTKGMVYLGATVGGLIGGYLPVLLGADGLSLWSILGSLVGGLIGIWVVYKFFG